MTRHLFPLIGLGLWACGRDKDDTSVESGGDNSPPVADAGLDREQSADLPVVLSAAGAFDPDGDAISYAWSLDSQPEGSTAALYSAEIVETTFLADRTGTYIASLRVTDSRGQVSSPDFVIITVVEGQAPFAVAGADQSGIQGDSFYLSGVASSDPLSRDLTYVWSLASAPVGSTASLTASGDSASFTADRQGTYVVGLVVDNGISQSLPDVVVVTVASADPEPPVAEAGDDLSVEDCTWLTLDGTASTDANDDVLQYFWDFEEVPEGSAVTEESLTDRYSATPSFYADRGGIYELALSVYDGEWWSLPDLMVVEATERALNTAPEVAAGADQAADGGTAGCVPAGPNFICDACDGVVVSVGADASITDEDGDPLTYTWSSSSEDVEFADPSAISTTVTLDGAIAQRPSACQDTSFTLTLEAEDCTGVFSSDDVVITVSCCGELDAP